MNETESPLPGTATCYPSLRYRLRSAADGARCWSRDRLFRAAMALVEDGGIVWHGRRELQAVGYDPDQDEEDPNKWIQQNLLDLLRVMSMQGHSGFSASYLVDTFSKLARYQPLAPLKGDASEWNEVGDGVWQNNRCSHVFKDADGRAYDIDARIYREPNGACFTRGGERCYIEFPYTPTREYIDVPASAEE